MAPGSDKKPDRHFSFKSLNIWFALSSLALLATTFWMIIADYAKPWKRLQAEFRDLERQQLIQEAEVEKQRINEQELIQIIDDIAEAEIRLEERRSEVRGTEKTLSKLEKKVYAADVSMRTTKSLLDTARWEYDRALQRGEKKGIEKTQARMNDLADQWRENRKDLELITAQQDQAKADLEAMRGALVAAENRLGALRKGLDNLEQRAANLDKSIDYFLLNAPLMDFFNPDLTIKQVILPGLYQDINFTTVERVDRCVTCHAAVNRPGFDGDNWTAPFRSHPRMEMFVGSSSPHPYTEFGCSACHGGLDRATNFARAGHSPLNEVEKERWEEAWDWKVQNYLETPILPTEYSEAGCMTCHAADVWTPGARNLETGRELATRMGCFVCHKIDYPVFEDMPRPGPNLARVAGKTRPNWAYKWIEAPREFRPTTWMPHFFFQENTSSELNQKRQRAEIASAVAYIWAKSETPVYEDPPAGDSVRGQEIFETVGCTGCHIIDSEATRDDFFPQINRLHGPNLINTGSKVSAGWLYDWIRDPKQYAPDTRMPDLRLTDQQAADVTAYLMASRNPAYEQAGMPEIDGAVRDELVLSYLQNTQTIERSQATLESMSGHERDVYLGRETIQKYGCWGCHDLQGFELAKPIGVELTEEGSKSLHQFDFGHVHEVPHTRQDWILEKMLQPRIWDEGMEEVKNYDELLKMPNFGMSEREAKAVVTMVLGFTKTSAEANRLAGQSARAAAIAQGRKLITRYNCQGCHLLEGEGHAIQTSIADAGLLPPNLAAQGARVQSDWLFEYLHDPSMERMRPWLTVQMPTFGFSDEDINTLVSYFSAKDHTEAFISDAVRPTDRDLTVGAVTFGMLQCTKCHPAGPQTDDGGAVSVGELAPSLLLAKDRLRHDWVADWIKDPQSFVPGTKMPANFPKRDDGTYSSPLLFALDAPMFASQKRAMMEHFDSEEELKSYLGDADYVTKVLRDHIWWNLD
jgi:cytochrome c2